MNTLYNSSNGDSSNALNNIISNNNNLQKIQNTPFYTDNFKDINTTTTSDFNDNIISKDWLRKNRKVDEDVFIEKIPISHILIKMDKLQQLHYNNVKAVESLNTQCVENTLQINDVKNHLLERIEQGESKIIKLVQNYNEKQRSTDSVWRNEQSDQLQAMQNSIHNLENYIRKFNVKISDHDSYLETIKNQLSTTEKRLDNLGKEYESQLQKLKQEVEVNRVTMEKKFESLQEEFNGLVRTNEKTCLTKLNSFNEDLQTEKSLHANTTNDIKKSINMLSDIIKRVEEKEVHSINTLKDSINSTQTIIASALKEKEGQLRQYIDQSHESLSTKLNENIMYSQQQITDITQKTVSLTGLVKEKLEGITKQQTRQTEDNTKNLTQFESKLSNSLQQRIKEILVKITALEETQRKKEEEYSIANTQIKERFKDLEKQCTHDINTFKVTHNATLDEKLQNYEEDFNKQLLSKENAIEEINYKIVQLFNKINSQEETHQTSTRDINKLIQDLETNEKKNSTSLSKEMETMVGNLKEQYESINNKFETMDENHKKTMTEFENKFKFKYLQIDQILEAYKEDFKECVNRKDMEEIMGQINQTTMYQIQEIKQNIETQQNSAEKELKIVHENVADQLHKIEEDLAKAKTTYITQTDYQEIIEKMDRSNQQYNSSINEINKMIDRMNRSLETIDSNLVSSVTKNYNELTKKVDNCMTNYTRATDTNQTNQTLIQGMKDDIDKIKETFTVQKRELTENEKVVSDQTKLINMVHEAIENLKQTNDLKLSKKEHQETLEKLENDRQSLVTMYEKLRQDYNDRETVLQTQIKRLEGQWEENNSNNTKSVKQFKSEMEENLHQMNKQITLIQTYLDEYKSKHRSLEEEIIKRDADLSSKKSIQLELEFLQEKVGKLPSEETVRTLLTKSIQNVKDEQEQLENQIADIRKTLRNHSLRNLFGNNSDNSNNVNTLSDTNTNTINNNNNNNTRCVNEPKNDSLQDITILQDKSKEIKKEIEKREVELTSSPPSPPKPAVIITTREIIPLNYNTPDKKPNEEENEHKPNTDDKKSIKDESRKEDNEN